jgi:hypothetical protein
MSKSAISWFEMLLITLSITATYTAQADAPSACKFLTPAAVSAALGKPVSGGIVSTVDHPGATASSCMYMAGATIVVLRVDERGTAGEATKEYGSQLDDSHAKDKDKKGLSEWKSDIQARAGWRCVRPARAITQPHAHCSQPLTLKDGNFLSLL